MTKLSNSRTVRVGLAAAALTTAAVASLCCPRRRTPPARPVSTGSRAGRWRAVTPTARWPTPAQAKCGTSITSTVPITDTALTKNGTRVHKCLVSAVNVMEARAATDGVVLKGWGWRDTQRQIELRIANCGGSDYYTVYEKPSFSQCNPPTARPGKSMHERGLAVDFYSPTSYGSITGSSPQFSWLQKNANQYA